MLWVLLAIASTIFYCLSNLTDSFLSNRVFSNPFTIVFFESLYKLGFLLILWQFFTLTELPEGIFWTLGIIGMIRAFYNIPYYIALKHEDTSVVVAFFSFGKVFVPLLAFLFLNEKLSFWQYFGFFLIVASNILLALRKKSTTMHSIKSALFMMLCTFLYATESIILKKALTEIPFFTVFFWAVFFAFCWSQLLWILPTVRSQIITTIPKLTKKTGGILALSMGFGFLGILFYTWALSFTSPTVIRGIMSFDPIIILLLTVLLKPFFPDVFKEDLNRKRLLKKLVLFTGIFCGIFLMI